MSKIDKAWNVIGMVILLASVATVLSLILSPKTVIEYSLKSNGYSSGIPAINVSIDNASDETINLSKDVTWDEAVDLVDSLNADLKKNSIK